MIDALKQLFESDAINEDIRAEIEEAWNARVKENIQSVTAELREEFAAKYEHDKQAMVESIDQMLSENLTAEIAEFAEDRKALSEQKAKYAVAMKENAHLLKDFVVNQLQKEVSELRSDKVKMSESYSKLEEFVVEALTSEIAEFQEDKNDLAETKVRLVKEAKAHLAKVKDNFIKRGATAVSNLVSESLNKEIHQLKEDIDTARKNDFGRKIFEAYAAEYGTSYLNEKSETAKLLKVIDTKDKQLAEAKAFAAKAKDIAVNVDTSRKALEESIKREKIINDLVSPLGKDQKEIMTDLLESVQTARLTKQFEKYLPTVIDGNTPAKQKAVLKEGKEVTGNREQPTNVSSEADESNVIDIKRLAGLN